MGRWRRGTGRSGGRVLIIRATIWANSSEQPEGEVLRTARRRLRGCLRRDAVLKVGFRDGFLGATSDVHGAPGRFYATS